MPIWFDMQSAAKALFFIVIGAAHNQLLVCLFAASPLNSSPV